MKSTWPWNASLGRLVKMALQRQMRGSLDAAAGFH